jgi:hypothetical protein
MDATCERELAMARHPLSEIRRPRCEGTQKARTASLTIFMVVLSSMQAVICYAFK